MRGTFPSRSRVDPSRRSGEVRGRLPSAARASTSRSTDGRSSARPAWRRPFDLLRSTTVLALTLILAVAFDLWVRVRILFPLRRREERRIAALNRAVRAWGISTFAVSRIGLGLRVRVQGTTPSSGRFLVLANHQSSVDIPALIATLRGLDLKFVAWEELRRGKPGVSVTLRHGGFAFVAKRRLGDDLAALRGFAVNLERHNGSPVLFPEGRRSDDGALRPFALAGAEIVRRTARLPILPVTLDGLHEARTIRTLHRAVGSRVTIRVSEPIPFDRTRRDPRDAFDRIEHEIRGNLEEIRARTRSPAARRTVTRRRGRARR